MNPTTVIKFIIAIIWDVLDFTIGRIPAFGTLFDIIGTFLALVLWGSAGVMALWEVVDITDQVDAEIPTLTLIGILTGLTGRQQ